MFKNQEMPSRQEKWSSRIGSKTLTTDVILRGITLMMSWYIKKKQEINPRNEIKSQKGWKKTLTTYIE